MANFSSQSKYQLFTCHPDLQVLFNEVIKTFDCIVLEGFRNEANQEKAFAAGNSKLHWPNGKHNRTPSIAVDVSPYPVDWNNASRFFWFAGYVMGIASQLRASGKITHDIRYGGDWNRNFDITDEKGLRDLVHFELVV
jgi:peptidoglycan L-alanyl-D-glutamate endopeptidase CwlK